MFEPGSFLVSLFWIANSNAVVLVSDTGNIVGVNPEDNGIGFMVRECTFYQLMPGCNFQVHIKQKKEF